MAPSSCLADTFSVRAVEKHASVQGYAPTSPWNLIGTEECFPVHQRHDTAARPWHDAVIPPSPWIDHVDSQSLHGDTAEQFGHLQQEAGEGYDFQLLSTNTSCDTSVQAQSPCFPQTRTLCDPVNAYGAIACPPSRTRKDANTFANFGQWHPLLRDSTEEHSPHTSSDLPPQRPMAPVRDPHAAARNTSQPHASFPSSKTSFLQEPQSTLESSNSADDGSRYCVLSSPTSPPRWSLNKLHTLRSPEDVVFDTIAHMSRSEMGHLWKIHKAKYFFERSARACREGQLDRAEEFRRRTTSRLSVFEALVDQKSQVIRSSTQVPRDPTQSVLESNNRRTRRRQRRLLHPCGVRPDSYPASQQAPANSVPSKSLSTVSTTAQPRLSQAEAQTLKDMIKALMKDDLALEKISLAGTSLGVEEWTRMNTATQRNPKPVSKNGHVASVTEHPIEQNFEQQYLTLEEVSEQGDLSLEEHNDQGDFSLERQSEQGDSTLEEHAKQNPTALMTETYYSDIKDTVAVNDRSLSASQDDPETSIRVYEDANTFMLLLLDESSSSPPLANASVTTLSDPPSLGVKETTRHGNLMQKEHSGQDQTRRNGHLEPKDSVATGPCPPACQGDLKPLSCVYEDANPYALLLEEELLKLPI